MNYCIINKSIQLYRIQIQHKKKKRGKKSSMKKRNCQLYFVIFGESSKPEISLCPSNILSFWCLIFYHNTLQLGKLFGFKHPFALYLC